jgi:hypothetical protein
MSRKPERFFGRDEEMKNTGGGQGPKRAVALYVEVSLLQLSYHRLSPCVVGIFGSNPPSLSGVQEHRHAL